MYKSPIVMKIHIVSNKLPKFTQMFDMGKFHEAHFCSYKYSKKKIYEKYA